MAVRKVYSVEEQKMLQQWEEITPKTGWLGDNPIPGELTFAVFHRVASKDLVLNMANGIYDPNPLFRDENYARKTRWGTIIAPPFFEHCICHMGPIVRRNVPPEVGSTIPLDFSTRWEFFQPIRLNDSFKVWCGPYTWEDRTSEDGTGLRIFLITDLMKFINQKNEVVCNKISTKLISILPASEAGKAPPKQTSKPKLEEYKYTKEEIDNIEHMYDSEVIRGSKIRWWDDVNVGDELPAVVKGPITPWDLLMEITGLGLNVLDTRGMRRLCPQATGLDPVTGVWHHTIELHLVPKTASWVPDPLDHIGYSGTTDPINHIMMTMHEHTMARAVTNWMGDDGFIRASSFKVSIHPPIGDTIFGKGKVVKKYVSENGEHLVDIESRLEGIRGLVHNTGIVTVGLLSKDSITEDLRRY